MRIGRSGSPEATQQTQETLSDNSTTALGRRFSQDSSQDVISNSALTIIFHQLNDYENIQKLPHSIQGIIVDYSHIADDFMMFVKEGKEIPKELLSFADHVVNLDLSKYENITTEHMLIMINTFKNLKSLTLSNCVDERVINSVSQISNLEQLSLEKCDITDQDIEVLSSLTKLKRFNLSECNNVTFAIDLTGFQAIVHLTFRRCANLNDSGVNEIAKIPLESILIENCHKVTRHGFMAVLHIKNCHFITSA